MILAAVMLLFSQCKDAQKAENKSDEPQVENQEKSEGDEIAEVDSEDGVLSEMKIPLEFTGEKPTVKDVAVALGQRFSVAVIGEEEAEMEDPGAIYESMAKAVKDGKCAEGEEVKVDEEKGCVWFKQTDGKEGSVIAVKLDGDKVVVDFHNMLDGVLSPAQFDGAEAYKVDVANKVLVFTEVSDETLVDEKGELK